MLNIPSTPCSRAKVFISSQNPAQLLGGECKEVLGGVQILCSDRPEDNEFLVLEEQAGFARASAIPYELYASWEICAEQEITKENQSELIEVSKLVVNFLLPSEPAVKAGWATAVKLPYYFEYNCLLDKEILIVSVNVDNSEAIGAGYGRAVFLPNA